jgi:hypothetical protein
MSDATTIWPSRTKMKIWLLTSTSQKQPTSMLSQRRESYCLVLNTPLTSLLSPKTLVSSITSKWILSFWEASIRFQSSFKANALKYRGKSR